MPKISYEKRIEELEKRVELLEKCVIEHTNILKKTRKIVDKIIEMEQYNIESADKLIKEHRVLSILVLIFNILFIVFILLYKFNIM